MDKLNILWTTTDKETVSNLISMYSINTLTNGLWDEMNIIVWGASSKLIGEDKDVQAEVRKMIAAGVKIEGCLACSDILGVTEILRSLGIDLKYMGEPFTKYLKNDEKMITV